MLSGAQAGVQGALAWALGKEEQLLGKQTPPTPTPNTQPPHFSNTAEMFGPAQREIDGVFGLPVALRVCECVGFI